MKKLIIIVAILFISACSWAADTAKQVDFLLSGYRHPTTDKVLSGGKVETYLDGTSTLSALWTDKDKGGTATNPIILDSAGQAEVFGDNIYKFLIYDSNDVLIETLNGLQYNTSLSSSSSLGTDYSCDMPTALAALGSVNKAQLDVDCDCIIASGTTVTSTDNITLNYINGTFDGVSGGATETLNIDGPQIGGNYQRFKSNLAVGLVEGITAYDKWFGVSGDGVTNDATELQFAIDSMEDTNGVLNLSDNILLTANIELKSGMTFLNGSIISNNGEQYILSGEIVENITFDGVDFTTADNGRFIRFWIDGVGGGVSISGLVVQNCTFTSTKVDDLSSGAIFVGYPQQLGSHSANDIQIINNKFLNVNGTGAVYLMDTVEAVVSGNLFESNYAFKNFPVHVYIVGANATCRNINVVNNTFDGVSANVSTGGMGYGIYDGDGDSRSCNYSDNVFRFGTVTTTETKSTAITVRSGTHTGININSNSIVPNASGFSFIAGIVVKETSFSNVNDNTIQVRTGNGIEDEENTGLSLGNNTIRTSTGNAIVFGSTDASSANTSTTYSACNKISLGNSSAANAYRFELYRSHVTIDGDFVELEQLSGYVADAATANQGSIQMRVLKKEYDWLQPRETIGFREGNYTSYSDDGDTITTSSFAIANKKHVDEVIASQSSTGTLVHIKYVSNDTSGVTGQMLSQIYTTTGTNVAYGNLYLQANTANGAEGIGLINGDVLPNSDGNIILGSAGAQYNNLYLVNGPVVSSDERVKEQIQELSAIEKKVAGEMQPLIKKYKLISQVQELGDKAPFHIGAIAQEVKEEFENDGLNPMNYNVIKHTVWWEDIEGNVYHEEGYGRVMNDRYGLNYTALIMFMLSAM